MNKPSRPKASAKRVPRKTKATHKTSPSNRQSTITATSQGAAYFQHHKLMAKDSLGRLLKNPFASTMTWLVLAIALSLPMTLYLALENIKQLSHSWDQSSQISLYLKASTLPRFAQELSDNLEDWPELSNVTYIDPDTALKQFSKSTGLSDVVEGLDDNPLPAVISILPKLSSTDMDGLTQLQQKLSKLAHVESVQLDLLWVQRLYQFMELGQRLVWALALLLGLAVLLIIGNTIRLSIESRRDEIRVVKLVGGTDAFVRRPFLYTGVWFGLGGGIIAWMLISAGLFWLSGPVEELVGLYGSDFQLLGLGMTDSLLLVIDAVVLGWFGAWLAVSKHLSSIEP